MKIRYEHGNITKDYSQHERTKNDDEGGEHSLSKIRGGHALAMDQQDGIEKIGHVCIPREIHTLDIIIKEVPNAGHTVRDDEQNENQATDAQ